MFVKETSNKFVVWLFNICNRDLNVVIYHGERVANGMRHVLNYNGAHTEFNFDILVDSMKFGSRVLSVEGSVG